MVLISKGGYKRIGKTIEESFAESTCEVVFDYFNGECCNSEIDRLIKIVKDEQCDLTIGIGGGKIFDTAKAVAYYAGTPVFICPTIASTDAPCSALSVIYTEEGVLKISVSSGESESCSDGYRYHHQIAGSSYCGWYGRCTGNIF